MKDGGRRTEKSEKSISPNETAQEDRAQKPGTKPGTKPENPAEPEMAEKKKKKKRGRNCAPQVGGRGGFLIYRANEDAIAQANWGVKRCMLDGRHIQNAYLGRAPGGASGACRALR